LPTPAARPATSLVHPIGAAAKPAPRAVAIFAAELAERATKASAQAASKPLRSTRLSRLLMLPRRLSCPRAIAATGHRVVLEKSVFARLRLRAVAAFLLARPFAAAPPAPVITAAVGVRVPMADAAVV
jgi:hypothetical protein